jgi:hypothetical protein
MQLPNEIILQIGTHLQSTRCFRTLSSLSQTSQSIHTLLSPILYRDLELSQEMLLIILNHPSPNFKHVKSLTLYNIWMDYDIDHTKAIISLPDSDVVFPNATTFTVRDSMDTALVFNPLPGLGSTSKLLAAERLVLDLHMISWRLGDLPSLWPISLKVIELKCRQWTLPFRTPGVHHIIHLCRRSPFKYKQNSTWDQKKYGDGVDEPDPDSEGYGSGNKTPILTMCRWMVNSIQSASAQEDQIEADAKAAGEGTEVTKRKRSTWEIRVGHGGRKEVEWAEKKVGEMLIMAGLDQGRVVEDKESGEIRVKCFKIVVDFEVDSNE